MADRGEDISGYFTNRGRLLTPPRGIRVDFSDDLLIEIDATARRLKVSRGTAIKTLVRRALEAQVGHR